MKRHVMTEEDITFSGSITVFLTILFLLFFSLIGAAVENVRILSAGGYMRVASHTAAMTVFGAYNKELYQDYGLFAYGGCDGKGTEDLAEEFTEILIKNIQSTPEGVQGEYGSFYRFRQVVGTVGDVDMLTERDIFLKQIEAYLKSAAVQDVTEKVREKVSGDSGDANIQEKLALTKEYEEGKFNVPKKQGAGGKKLPDKKNALKENEAEGNPLEVFTDLMRDGILNLVCDAGRLSDGIIPASDSTGQSSDSVQDNKEIGKTGAAEYLKELLREEKTDGDISAKAGEEKAQNALGKEGDIQAKDKNMINKGLDKAKYICYANKQFSRYTKNRNRTVSYGLEYLISGKKREKDNLSHVVNKILRMRLLLNIGCILTDKVLQQKSLATATILAGFTGLPPVIHAVQYTILLILAFEEACVDATALLKGKSVPVIKRPGDLKVRYEEICMVSKKFFAVKAEEYADGGRSLATGITYDEYLYFFLLQQSAEKLQNRCFDVIQYDLREKYNQSFTIRTCICRSRYEIEYQQPFLFSYLPYLNSEKSGDLTMGRLEVDYGYKSG